MNYSQTVASFPTLNELNSELNRVQRRAMHSLLQRVAEGEGLNVDRLLEKYLHTESDDVQQPRCKAQTTKRAQCTRVAKEGSNYCKAHQKKIDSE